MVARVVIPKTAVTPRNCHDLPVRRAVHAGRTAALDWLTPDLTNQNSASHTEPPASPT